MSVPAPYRRRVVDDELDELFGDLDEVIITTGPMAYRREDGVAVVPLALLGP